MTQQAAEGRVANGTTTTESAVEKVVLTAMWTSGVAVRLQLPQPRLSINQRKRGRDVAEGDMMQPPRPSLPNESRENQHQTTTTTGITLTAAVTHSDDGAGGRGNPLDDGSARTRHTMSRISRSLTEVLQLLHRTIPAAPLPLHEDEDNHNRTFCCLWMWRPIRSVGCVVQRPRDGATVIRAVSNAFRVAVIRFSRWSLRTLPSHDVEATVTESLQWVWRGTSSARGASGHLSGYFRITGDSDFEAWCRLPCHRTWMEEQPSGSSSSEIPVGLSMSRGVIVPGGRDAATSAFHDVVLCWSRASLLV